MDFIEPVGPTYFDESITTLPIFGVQRGVFDGDTADDVRKGLLGAEAVVDRQMLLPDIIRWSTRQGASRRRQILDVNIRTGAIWLESDRPWPSDVRELALRVVEPAPLPPWTDLEGTLRRIGAFPVGTDALRVRVRRAWQRSARAALWRKGTRSDYDMDVTRSFSVVLDMPFGEVPVTGSGSKLSVSYDHSSARTGLNVTWAPLTGQSWQAPLISQSHANARFAEMFSHAARLRFQSSLAYRVIEHGALAFLSPCWAYHARFNIGPRRFAADYALPSTTFDEFLPVPMRLSDPTRWSSRHSDGTVDWDAMRPPRALISWLGHPGGRLPYSLETVTGLVKSLVANGWGYRAFADEDAFQWDWASKAAGGSGSANLAWYVGHAHGGGLMLSPPDRSVLSCSASSFSGTLGWMLADACGPLQDVVTGGLVSVFDRWNHAFDGLHALLGFATPQTPQGKQGPAAMAYAFAGDPIARSWFRAVLQHQANTCSTGIPWVAGMFAVAGDNSTIDDRLPGMGPAVPPPFDDDTFLAVWVPVG